MVTYANVVYTTHVSRLQKTLIIGDPLQTFTLRAFHGHSRSLEPIRIDRLHFLLVFHYVIDRSRTVSQINGDFGRKLQTFLTTHVYLTSPLRGSPWNFVTVVWVKNYSVMPLSDGGKSLTICAYIDTIPECDRRKD